MGDAPAMEHRLGDYVISVATDFGPRILGVRRHDSPEMLVRLGPEIAIESNGALFGLGGGHRLWTAPEIPDVTYAPDDAAVRVKAGDTTVRVTGPPDAAGFSKEIEVSSKGDGLEVAHRLRRHGAEPASAAPWAITQLPLGGTAIVPIGGSGPNGFQADSSLVLWPYTDLADRRLTFGRRHVNLEAAAGPKLKLGTGPDPGQLGYLRDGWLFMKTVAPAGDGAHVDLGAIAQVFSNEEFCELETLGAIVILEDDEHVEHFETWRIMPCAHLDDAVERVLA